MMREQPDTRKPYDPKKLTGSQILLLLGVAGVALAVCVALQIMGQPLYYAVPVLVVGGLVGRLVWNTSYRKVDPKKPRDDKKHGR